MHNGIVLDEADLKQVLADYFCVSEDKIIRSENMHIVITDEIKEVKNDKEMVEIRRDQGRKDCLPDGHSIYWNGGGSI